MAFIFSIFSVTSLAILYMRRKADMQSSGVCFLHRTNSCSSWLRASRALLLLSLEYKWYRLASIRTGSNKSKLGSPRRERCFLFNRNFTSMRFKCLFLLVLLSSPTSRLFIFSSSSLKCKVWGLMIRADWSSSKGWLRSTWCLAFNAAICWTRSVNRDTNNYICIL